MPSNGCDVARQRDSKVQGLSTLRVRDVKANRTAAHDKSAKGHSKSIQLQFHDDQFPQELRAREKIEGAAALDFGVEWTCTPWGRQGVGDQRRPPCRGRFAN